MTGTQTAGNVRLMITSMAALALFAQGARAQGGGGAQSARIMVATKDTSGRVNQVIIITPLIDSLVKRLNVLPLGSAEFFATNAALETAISQQLPSRATTGQVRFEIAAPRAALRKGPMDVAPQGTLGFTTDGVNRTWYTPAGNLLQYFEYPTVVSIETNSPAARAGVRIGDLLTAYDGVDVKKNPVNMTQLLTPGRDIIVKLRRESDLRDVPMTVEKASPELIAERRADAMREMAPPFDAERRLVETQAMAARASTPTAVSKAPVAVAGVAAGGYREIPAGAVTIAPSVMVMGVLGAAMTSIDPDLASAVRGMEGKRGVLVTRVPPGSLADRTGLRGGDVILRVDASDVATVDQFRVRIALAEQTGQEKVKLTILRAGKTQEIMYVTR